MAELRRKKENIPDNVVLKYSRHNVTACHADELPASAAVALLFVQTQCALNLRSTWTPARPAMLWRALDRVSLTSPFDGKSRGGVVPTTTPPTPSFLREPLPPTPLFAIGSPSQSRIALLGKLMTALALEEGVLISDNFFSCRTEPWAGPKVCINGMLSAADVAEVRAARTPVLVIDMYVALGLARLSR